MGTIYLSFLVEFYQPPMQNEAVLSRVTRECYLPMAKLFNCALGPKFSISIAHSLMVLLERYGWADGLVRLINQAMEHGAVEIVHSGAYHPIFPLLPEKEIRRQIGLDIAFKQPKLRQPQPRNGILSPEYCYDDRLIELFRTMGFRWTAIDDSILGQCGIPVPEEGIYHIDNFAVLTCTSFWNHEIRDGGANGYWTGRDFVRHLSAEARPKALDSYKVFALWGETFGHHIPYYQETFLRDMLFELQACDNVRLCLVSELLQVQSLRAIEKTRLPSGYFPACSVASDAASHARNDPYPHWRSPGNPVHEKLWRLTDLVLGACSQINFEDNRNASLRRILDSAFYSGQYYSASPWFWNPKSIFEGIDLQMRALVQYAHLMKDYQTLEEGQRLYTELVWETFRIDREGERRQ